MGDYEDVEFCDGCDNPEDECTCEGEVMTLKYNEKTGQLEEYKEEDWVSIKAEEMKLITGFIKENGSKFKDYCERNR